MRNRMYTILWAQGPEPTHMKPLARPIQNTPSLQLFLSLQQQHNSRQQEVMHTKNSFRIKAGCRNTHLIIPPSKNELARSCKNLARILHARLAWHMHAICPFSCMILAPSCTYLARNGARFCKSCCKKHFLHTFCKILQELVQNCARIVQEKGPAYRVHVPSKSCMQDSCTILHNLASSFLLGIVIMRFMGHLHVLYLHHKNIV